jgi:hypothetical protein
MCVILINNIIGIMWDLLAYFLTKCGGPIGTTTNNNFHEFSLEPEEELKFAQQRQNMGKNLSSHL